MLRWTPAILLSLLACAPATPQSTAPRAAPAVTSPSARAVADAPGADPKLNESWSSDDIDPLVSRLEEESREIFVHRERLVEVVAPKPGQAIADIGSGSGFMTLLFAQAVGAEGKVYAIDINPTMLARLDDLAGKRGLKNLETRKADQTATPLEPDSVDLVFICDTYHHFEQPSATMRSVLAALKPGGELVLVDFERIPGKTEKRMLDHVRAGKDVFRQEILDVGFELVTEHDLSELEENYVLRFRRPG